MCYIMSLKADKFKYGDAFLKISKNNQEFEGSGVQGWHCTWVNKAGLGRPSAFSILKGVLTSPTPHFCLLMWDEGNINYIIRKKTWLS